MKLVLLIGYIIIIMLPTILHYDSYGVINNDTMAHLEAFEKMAVQGYNGLYGGQEITGWLINHSGLEPQTTFMYFNFAMLAIAGLVSGYMVYTLTGNKLASYITAPIVTFGTGGVMHLFYSGTIFNLIGVMILLPCAIIIYYHIYKKFGWKWTIGLSPLALLIGVYHPSLGGGLFYSGELQESIISPIDSLNVYFGIFNTITLLISVYIVRKTGSMNTCSFVVVSGLLVVSSACGVIALYGLNPFPSRLMINMCLMLILATVILLGFALNNSNNKIKYSLVVVSSISSILGLSSWIMNSVIRGIPASEILS